MANFPKADFTKLPPLEDKASQETISVTEKILSVCSYAAHIALIAAFVSLAVFIQSNIGLILTAAPQ
jgi:hypothetical protein